MLNSERKCGNCRQPGHTRRTCPTGEYVSSVTLTPVPSRAQQAEMDMRRAGGAAAELLPLGKAIAELFSAPEHVHTFQYGDDGHHSGSFCSCGLEEPDIPHVDGCDCTMCALAQFNALPGIYTGEKPGPWFYAAFPGICEKGGEGFDQGDEVRADGQGGYECRDCTTAVELAENPPSAPPAWERPTAANVKMPASTVTSADLDRRPMAAPDLFATPAPVIVTAGERDEDPLTNRSGYLIKDPRTGEFNQYKNGNVKGFTRTTTFIKAASDSKAIESWNKRNVVMGAALRPDLVKQAEGLTHADHREQLDKIADLLGEASGSKRGSSMGTAIHSITEAVDRGEQVNVPIEYSSLITQYRAKLTAAGFQVVPELIERTVFLPQYGGIAGSFDRVLFHKPTRTYVMADVKTGKDLSYGWDEIEAQEWVYTEAYNQFGTWDHTLKVWEPPQYRVRTDYGLVIHMPVEGKKAGILSLERTDLKRGGAYAALCGDVRARRQVKAKAVPWELSAPVAPPERTWEDRFRSVMTRQDAGTFWEMARDEGVEPMELNRLVQVAQQRLRELDSTV